MPTELPPPCTGDCAGDGAVTVDEVILLVRIAVGEEAIGACAAGDRNADRSITIDGIVTAVGDALEGCN